MAVILVIDDDVQICETMQRMISRGGHQCATALTLASGAEVLRTTPVDVVFLDVRLPDGDGLEALPAIMEMPSKPEVIVLTGEVSANGAATAIHGGVWEYLVKPMSMQDTMQRLERALTYRESKRTQESVRLCLHNVVGVSPAFRKSLDQVAKAARSEAPALLTGETGTGKELMARTIHSNSQRRERPFIVVDCAALSETLIESLLFGHKKGSFTGAHADSLGLIRAADNGVLFLDEVGELSLTAQKTFLRVLQEKRFRPVGEIKEFSSDFRLLAATNRNLGTMVDKGEFRSDLYYRLKAVEVHIPPLRRRQQDISLLAIYRAGALAKSYDVRRKSLDQELLEQLRLYHWPGNVRELFGVMETAFVAGWDSDVLYPRHLPSALRIAVTTQLLQRDNEVLSEESIPTPPDPEATLNSPHDTLLSKAATQPPESMTGAPPPPEEPPAPRQEANAAYAQALPSATHMAQSLATVPAFPTLKAFKRSMESAYLQVLQDVTGGEVELMQSLSGLSKSHLYALLKKTRQPGH